MSDSSGGAPGSRRANHAVSGGVAVVMAALVVGLGLLLWSSQAHARDGLVDRFQTRASLTSGFARDYVDDLARRERAQAERLLAGQTVNEATFVQVVGSFEFRAAVLLDERGRLLHVWPARPELLGRDMTVDHSHLRVALAGKVGVSEMVPSASAALPVTAVAVPFDSAAGRRVFSGAFSAAAPLGSYFDSAVPVAGGTGFLIDGSGQVLAGRDEMGHSTRIDGTSDGVLELSGDDGKTTVAIASVPDTPWRVVLTAPSHRLFAPVSGARIWAPWALLAALGVSAAISVALLERLSQARAKAAFLSETDVLTSLPNRRATASRLDRALAESSRQHEPLAVLMVDLDHFKAVNDAYGHDAGDAVLRAVAGALRAATREEDAAGRWGGEEFLVVLRHAGRDAAATAAERIRQELTVLPLPASVRSHRVTASIGVAVLIDGDNASTLAARADGALYTAKAQGRDRVVVAGEERIACRPTDAQLKLLKAP